jgi:hypothetical protein
MATVKQAALPKFAMAFESNTIDHLGLRLYSTLPPVIAEIVSNAYDAEAPKIEITIPEGPITPVTEVVVRDYGHGMTPDELVKEYLPIGRNRRGQNSADVMSKNNKVRVTGRKGLGKLSAFGVAGEMDVRTIANGFAVTLRFNYFAIKKWAQKYGTKPYEPEVVDDRTGKTKDPSGTEVRLRGFHRKLPFSPQIVRRGLARRARFIGTKFQVYVNGKPIGPGDRIRREDCKISWSLDEIPVPKVGPGLKTSGWLGFLPEAAQTERGIDIFANNKAVELGSFFNFSSTHAQFARAHVIGEVHADFLDEEDDLAATARNSVVWESPQGEALEDWGQELMKWAFDSWVKARKEEKTNRIIKVGNFDQWLTSRSAHERRVAERLVNILVDDDRLDSESAEPLLDIVKASVEHYAFRELVDEIEEKGSNIDMLLQLFDEWRLIEAREHLRLSDGRLAAIDQLHEFIENGALEVQQMQPLFEAHPWLIDQAWTEVDGQATYTKMLREQFPEKKTISAEDRRIDLLGMAVSGKLTVVELKRPEKVLSKKDLEQIADYVFWARSKIVNTGPHSPNSASGLLIVGHLTSNPEVLQRRNMLAQQQIFVESYSDLYAKATEYYGEVRRVLKKYAPEYARQRKLKPVAVPKTAS